MKKTLLMGALAMAAVASQAQTIIYDTITGNTGVTTTGGLPRNRMADGFNALTAGAGQTWRIDKIELALYVAAAGTYANSTARILVHNDWDATATHPTSDFSNTASNVNWGLGTITTTGVAAFIYTFDYAANNLSFNLVDGQSMGLEVEWLVGGVANQSLALGLRDVDPNSVLAGTSSTNLFYRDTDSNGSMTSLDRRTITGWTNSNAMIRLTATAVPEPATMAVLGLGVAALIRRRKNA